ncbi:TrbI/VirB10 family protein [Sphingomonas sp. JC676]|uniref:TrbI/VirB10 family protein n=1 Tax=Sphingomonas sp. JC676 TaxID=2768065 RepID=UPI0016578684|nr:TrbI/VirB10 family protein [Sphingomonas sp. JC676]MBC9030847.1 TrbI/VirB10 family protein [Sphingomonas sp. JC676]
MTEASSQETGTAPDQASLPPKADPADFVLRGAPRRVVRFRRSVIMAGAGAAAVAVIGIASLALRPISGPIMPTDDKSVESEARRPPEALAGAPRGYGDVPRLGAPLPGDLGGPILDRQRALAGHDTVEAEPVQTVSPQATDAERERRITERRTARQSGVMMQLAGGQRTPSEAPGAQGETGTLAPSIGAVTGPSPAGSMRLAGSQQQKEAFLAAPQDAVDVNPHELRSAASPNMLSAGSVIAASLITGVNSDLPGLVTAQVTENIFDSATGRALLVPQGSRLIGKYDSVVAFGQQRALIVWQRIMLPDGSSLRIDNVPATDASGYAGLQDRVDFHTWTLLKGVVLSTLLGVSSELAFTGDGDLVEAMRRSPQDNVSRAGDQITQRNLNIQPTIRIRPGAQVWLIVHKDLVLAPWREGSR